MTRRTFLTRSVFGSFGLLLKLGQIGLGTGRSGYPGHLPALDWAEVTGPGPWAG